MSSPSVLPSKNTFIRILIFEFLIFFAQTWNIMNSPELPGLPGPSINLTVMTGERPSQPDHIKQLENSQISFISHWFYILIQEAKNSLIVSSQTGRVCVCLLTFPVQRENDISTKLANRCVKCDVWSVTLHLSLITGDFFYMNRI